MTGRSPAAKGAPPSATKGQRTLASFFAPGAPAPTKKEGSGGGAGGGAGAGAGAGAPLKDANGGEGRVSVVPVGGALGRPGGWGVRARGGRGVHPPPHCLLE